MSSIKRYTMYGTPGGYQEREDENGEWVRYEDIMHPAEEWATKERERIFANPEEYIAEEHNMLFSEEELKNLSQSLRGGI